MLVLDSESKSEESDSIWCSVFFFNLTFSLFSTVKYWSRTLALELLQDNTLISCLRPLLVKAFLLAFFEPFILAKVKHLSVLWVVRSEEHTSELQSLAYLVCRLLLEKKKKKIK